VLLVVVLLVCLVAAGGRGLPLGVLAVGLFAGVPAALNAVGVVLVHRANRVLNLAQLSLGTVAGLAFAELGHNRLLLRALNGIGILPKPDTAGDLVRGGLLDVRPGAANVLDQVPASAPLTDELVKQIVPGKVGRSLLAIYSAPKPLVLLDYVLCLVFAIALAAGLTWLVHYLVVRRFAEAPRLVLTVVTLGVGGVALVLGQRVVNLLGDGLGPSLQAGAALPVPLPGSVELGPATLTTTDVVSLLLGVAALAAVVLWLRRARSGVVLRGAADNPQRARTLGVDLDAVTSQAWLVAGALSGLAAVLSVARSGATALEGYDALVRVLGAAVAAGFVGVPLSFLAGIGTGVVDQAALWSFGSGAVVTGLLLVMITLLLLAQGRKGSRADREVVTSSLSSRQQRPVPDRIRALPQYRRAVRVMTVLGILVGLAWPWVMSPSQTTLGASALLQAIVLLSVLVLTGWAGQISLAQMAFAGIGAWTAAVSGLPLPLAVLAAAVVGAGVAAATGLPALRLQGQHLAVVTLALSVAVSALVLGPTYLGSLLPSKLDRPVLLGLDLEDGKVFYYLCLLACTGAVFTVTGMRRSRTGRALIASKDNPFGAQAFGIDLVRARLTAFSAAGALAAVAGALIAYAEKGVSPPSFGPDQSVAVFAAALVGGLGSVAGPLAGAGLLALLDLLAESPFGLVTNILLDPRLLVVVVLLTVPGGVVSMASAGRDAWLRRLAEKNGLSLPRTSRPADPESLLLPIAKPSGERSGVPTQRYRLDGQWLVGPDREAPVRRG
jgi:branched-chain amino acid transport system permease protein